MAEVRAPIAPTDVPKRRPVPRWVEVGAAYSWRLLVIGLAIGAVVWLTGQLVLVVVPVGVAVLLTRALHPVATRLRRAGLHHGLAALVALIGFLVLVGGALAFVGWAVAGEVGDLGPTLSKGLDDITNWLVNDSPFDVSRADVNRWREQAGDALRSFIGSGNRSILSSAIVAAEIAVGILLALIVTFFFLKDGHRMGEASVRMLPPERRDLGRRVLRRAWDAIGGFLRGAAILGIVEACIIGLTLLLAGGGLIVPVMLVTFLGAFVPIVGAVAAGVIAVLVALVTAGVVPALVVAVVAVIVQQLDNDLLAPFIYGHALQLHPLVVLLGIAAGGSLFGLLGAFFAVPFLAVTLNAIDEIRSDRRDRAGAVAPVPPSAATTIARR
jgi:predicted PurR-regulated permease PerM